MNRVIVNFSCGASSAVAAKIAVDAWSKSREVRVVYADLLADEHPDNRRFLEEVEKWIGVPIELHRNEKYSGIDDVFLQNRYIVGITGAACTKRLKRDVIDAICDPGDVRVIGYSNDPKERQRAIGLQARNLQMKFAWVLIDGGITKTDCYHILSNAGIELPTMYLLGYEHNNCIGCVKGGMGYWNKIRIDFPEVFAKRAAIQRDIGAGFGGGGSQFFLDELDPEAGRDVPEQDIECGVFCSGYSDVLTEAVKTAEAMT